MENAQIDSEIIAALIGAGVAVFVLVVRDICVPWFVAKKQSTQKFRSIQEKYAQPMAVSAVALFYRLNEITVDKRFSYLSEKGQKSKFGKYKYESTIYRIASLIGWIRALRLEHSYLIQPEPKSGPNLYEVIHKFESALADGPHVEEDIVRRLASLWSIQLPSNENLIKRIARRIDTIRDNALHENKNGNVSSFNELEGDGQTEAISLIAFVFSDELNIREINQKTLDETKNRAADFLSPKQAWIYRDLQSVIGNLMIKEIKDAQRRFDVIGFEVFEEMFSKGNKWFSEIANIIKDLDFDINDMFDYRINQLHKVMEVAAEIIVEIDKLESTVRLVNKQTLQQAKKYLS